MIDEVNMEQNLQDQNTVVAEPVSDQSLNETVESVPTAPTEKMIPQSQVNKIASREAKAAFERAKREVTAKYEEQLKNMQAGSSESANIGGMPDEESIVRLIRQTAQQMSAESLANQIHQSFESKIDQAKSKYPDFDEKFAALNIDQHPELVLWTKDLDNVGDVMYEMASNPTKMSQILTLANGGFPDLATAALKSMAASIKANETAKSNVKDIPKPIDQIKPSNIGIDSGNMSVSDFRKMFR